YSRAQRFLAVSEFVANELLRGGVPGEKIDVVYDGVELNTTAEQRRSDQSFKVVALGSRDPGKGRVLVEQAATIAALPIEFSEELAKDLVNATAFLYVTQSEGLGSAALLAMSMGIPVIASEVGGLPEIVVDGETGLLVENDPALIAGAILKLREN